MIVIDILDKNQMKLYSTDKMASFSNTCKWDRKISAFKCRKTRLKAKSKQIEFNQYFLININKCTKSI